MKEAGDWTKLFQLQLHIAATRVTVQIEATSVRHKYQRDLQVSTEAFY